MRCPAPRRSRARPRWTPCPGSASCASPPTLSRQALRASSVWPRASSSSARTSWAIMPPVTSFASGSPTSSRIRSASSRSPSWRAVSAMLMRMLVASSEACSRSQQRYGDLGVPRRLVMSPGVEVEHGELGVQRGDLPGRGGVVGRGQRLLDVGPGVVDLALVLREHRSPLPRHQRGGRIGVVDHAQGGRGPVGGLDAGAEDHLDHAGPRLLRASRAGPSSPSARRPRRVAGSRRGPAGEPAPPGSPGRAREEGPSRGGPAGRGRPGRRTADGSR